MEKERFLPKVSVLLPTYNEEDSIKETIKSLLYQTYKSFELIIIDSSDDRTFEIARSFKDPRIKLLKTKQGISDQLNKGLEISRGKYIARVDADCIAHKKRLELQTTFLNKNPEIGIVGTWTKLIMPNGETKIHKYPLNDREIKEKLVKGPRFMHPSIMVRKNIFDKVGGYPGHSLRAQDYSFYVKAMSHTQFNNLPRALLTKRVKYYRLKKMEHLRMALRMIKCSSLAFLKCRKVSLLPVWQRSLYRRTKIFFERLIYGKDTFLGI